MSNFIPINIIPMNRFTRKKPAWATPDFNPDANQRVSADMSGISPQTQKGLLELEREMMPQPQVQPMGVGGVQKDPRATIQLPNGQFVTPEQYQKLLQKLRTRT